MWLWRRSHIIQLWAKLGYLVYQALFVNKVEQEDSASHIPNLIAWSASLLSVPLEAQGHQDDK